MVFIFDIHIHSKYSRATSKDLNIKNLSHWGKVKGLHLLGTGDFTHPKWLQELKENLKESSYEGIYENDGMLYMLQVEVNNVFNYNEKNRKVHNVILARDFDVVYQINDIFSKYGDLEEDGRPTLRLSCVDMIDELKSFSLNKDVFVIPAHAWTPWFGVYGSKSGFDSLEECFQENKKDIFAIETGLSSDPYMNGLVAETRELSLVSNSDAHSFWPWRLGREANILDVEKDEVSFDLIFDKIKKKELKTIEVDPSYGKYHYDGHRKCGVWMDPNKAKAINNICPVCGRKLTIGVMHRVIDLGDINIEKNIHPQQYYTLLPLHELISKYYNTSMNSKKVWNIYNDLISLFGNEYNLLLLENEEKIRENIKDKDLAELIIKNRKGKLYVRPGYDGEYGELILDEKKIKKEAGIKQKTLF